MVYYQHCRQNSSKLLSGAGDKSAKFSFCFTRFVKRFSVFFLLSVYLALKNPKPTSFLTSSPFLHSLSNRFIVFNRLRGHTPLL